LSLSAVMRAHPTFSVQQALEALQALRALGASGDDAPPLAESIAGAAQLPRLQPPSCCFFLQGLCAFGAQCENAHVVSERCHFGEKCRAGHTKPRIESLVWYSTNVCKPVPKTP
jgi:hypothetical protein